MRVAWLALIVSAASGLRGGSVGKRAHRLHPINAASKGFGNVRSRDRRPEPNDACACGSGATYRACCSRLHDGAPAMSVEDLLRARFSAYEYKLPDFLLSPAFTVGVEDSKDARRELDQYMGSYRFLNITISKPIALAPDSGRERAECEMECCYRARAADIFRKHSKVIDERVVTFKERSRFVKGVDGGWRYCAAESESSYEGEQGYDRAGAEERFRQSIRGKRERGVTLLPREVAYAEEHGL